MPPLSLKNLGKTFASGTKAVDDLTLEVADGELLVLVGPSGCGKTTIFRLITGLTTPTSGEVFLGGRAVTRLPIFQRNIGMVFQRPALHPHHSVRTNLGFGLMLRQRESWWRWLLSAQRRRQADERRQRVMVMAERLGLTAVLDHKPGELSGGQQQRVALGRTLLREPALLLLDEPLSNLDGPLRQELRRELHLLQKQLHLTMIYVTHDSTEALSLGDRIAVLNQGRLQQVDRPEVLYAQPANRFVGGFVGWPAMSFVDGELRLVEGTLIFAAGPDGLPVPPAVAASWAPWVRRPLTLGIRPEDVRLDTAGWSMQVRLVEALGRGKLLTLSGRMGELSALLPEDCQTSGPADTMVAGKNVMVNLQFHRVCLFDRQSGLALVVRPDG